MAKLIELMARFIDRLTLGHRFLAVPAKAQSGRGCRSLCLGCDARTPCTLGRQFDRRD